MAQRTRYPRATSYQLASSLPPSHHVIVEPTKGFDKSQPPIDLEPGQTPDSENFVVEDGFLTVRSGLSIFGDDPQLEDVGLFCAEHHGVSGTRYPLIGSAQTITFFNGTTWSDLSYLGLGGNTLSGDSTEFMFYTSVYDAASDENLAIICNNKDMPKVWVPAATVYSDLTDFRSVESFAKIPYALDDRLCFFNCASSQTTYTTRVRWSERGLASNFSTVGAGFEDIMDMKGAGSGVAVREFDALLFSTEEVWIQRPRRDNFAFDFFALDRSIGCPYPKTIVKTPQGVIFLTRELEPYIASGDGQPKPIGQSVHRHLRGNVMNADRAFGIYNSKRQRYELYYDSGSAEGRPNRALYLDMDSGSWHPVNLHDYMVGIGSEVGADLGGDIIWDNVDKTWNEIDTAWNNMTESTTQDKDVFLISSSGTAFRMRPEQVTDNGSTVTARWISHAMSGEDPSIKQTFHEMWLEYEADSAGSFDIATRGSPTNPNFRNSRTYTFGAFEDKVYAPVLETGNHPQFRIQVDNGSRPRFSRFHAKLRDHGQF